MYVLFEVLFRENSQRGVYPRLFRPNGDLSKTPPREALPHAPSCFKFYADALARYPQPMPSTRAFFVFFGHVLGLTVAWRRRCESEPDF